MPRKKKEAEETEETSRKISKGRDEFHREIWLSQQRRGTISIGKNASPNPTPPPPPRLKGTLLF